MKRQAPTGPGQSALWTTPAPVGQPPLAELAIDPAVTRDDVLRALAQVKRERGKIGT